MDVCDFGHYDTVVVGGGTAGSSCAISAAREGNKTLVVERTIALGGTPVHALVTPMMPSPVAHEKNLRDIEARLQALGITTRDNVMGYIYSTAETKTEVLEQLLLEAGGEILYEADLVSAEVEKNHIVAIIVNTPQGLLRISADQFVDATGDAFLSRLAGVPVVAGDEDGHNQMTSLRFEMGGIDVERYRAWIRELGDTFSPLMEGYFFESAMSLGRGHKLEPIFREAVAEGWLHEDDIVYYQAFSLPNQPGCMTFNCPHMPQLKCNLDVRDRSSAIIEARQKIRRLINFLTHKFPGFEHAYLIRVASALGVRESYRIQGTYTLTEEDYLARCRVDDPVAKGTWYIDVHSQKGLLHLDKFKDGEYYEIPYRSLTNQTISNMLTVGRCISTTFKTQASVRIQPTCIDMGDSAGRACARARKAGVELNQFDGRGLMDN